MIAEQNPTLTLLQRALEQDRAIQQMHLQGLRDCCDRLEARYAAANSRDAWAGDTTMLEEALRTSHAWIRWLSGVDATVLLLNASPRLRRSIC